MVRPIAAAVVLCSMSLSLSLSSFGGVKSHTVILPSDRPTAIGAIPYCIAEPSVRKEIDVMRTSLFLVLLFRGLCPSENKSRSWRVFIR